ncbi:MAG TPA: acyl-CoA thioesterase II, partial [Acidimicrobiaceae bacterium]|nr:acyl-CoA thioesterase II [Acidimicrobiaceae bacterium]
YPFNRREALPPTQRVWFRANGDLPDGQVLHTCLLTYASDMTLLDTTLLPHGSGATDRSVMMASLDHAMWFHGPFRADEWLLYDQHTPAASGARGLATGRVFTQHGRLVANVVQEGLIRRVEP